MGGIFFNSNDTIAYTHDKHLIPFLTHDQNAAERLPQFHCNIPVSNEVNAHSRVDKPALINCYSSFVGRESLVARIVVQYPGGHLLTTAELFGATEKPLATSSDMHRDARALAALHCSLTSPRAVRRVFLTDSSPLRGAKHTI